MLQNPHNVSYATLTPLAASLRLTLAWTATGGPTM
jgi:hypothetical protein